MAMFKKNIKKFTFLIPFVFIFSFFPFISSAQTLGSQIYLTTSPEVPVAGKLVRVFVSYSLSDLTRANISWYVNNTLQSQGLGQKEISVPAGRVGERTQVRVSIKTMEGPTISQTIAFTPASVDILWETDSYTPPLYKGKALPTQGSTVRLTAVPTFIRNGTLINPADLYYTWEGSDTSSKEARKGAYSIEIPFDKNSSGKNISVFVTTANKTISAKQEISLPTIVPEVMFYENNPIYGILYNKAIPNTFTSPKKTLSIIAEPFYIPSSILLFEQQQAWSLNGSMQAPEGDTRTLTISQEGVSGGTPNAIEFSITNKIFNGGILKKILSLTL
jgi:hypothetical protein